MAQTEFEASFGPRPLRYWIVLVIASLFGGLPLIVATEGVPSVVPLAVTLAVLWVVFGVIVAIVYWIWWRDRCVVCMLLDSLHVSFGRRTLFTLPWTDMEGIDQLPAGQLPVMWRLTAWTLGWSPNRNLAHIRLRRMARQVLFKGRITTRGLGMPLFTRHLYLAPSDVGAFIESGRARLTPPA